jgi:predicted SAM-dependent methyltransferase
MNKQSLYMAVAQSFAWLRRHQHITTSVDESVKINIGSGLVVTGDWYNIDANMNTVIAKLPHALLPLFYRSTGVKNWYTEEFFVAQITRHRFIHHNILNGIPFADGVADYIYSSHFFEHFFYDEAAFIAREALRVLKPDGVLRVCVPDLEIAVNTYLAGHREAALQYFFEGGKSDYFSRHKYMYDFALLKNLLEKAGFRTITRCAYQQGATPDVDVLDNRPEQTLFVEAVK